MSFSLRLRVATKAALFHFLGSVIVAALAAVLVFLVWYPHPYGLLSGGLSLFLILVSVDLICGPALTLVLFNPRKSRRELFADMSLVVSIQLAALTYGIYIVHQARPLFLVHEVDRFRVIGLPDYQGDDVSQMLSSLDPSIQPHWLNGPVIVGVRAPRDAKERQEVMLDSVFGGRDYSQRPEFYVPYDVAYQAKALARAKPLKAFIERYPDSLSEMTKLLDKSGVALENALFLPVLHKQEWVAIMDQSARILGFLPGDGFLVP
ncbi:pilus assembly protein [Alcaligenes sp.]|uniref:pilus assembly protein n=1 Tax=Alcaligenes sp. TaxID=512 RepID=UPI003D057CC2